MSSFQGKLDEIEEISIDKFSGADNIESTAFFLSHCHYDHTIGLDSAEFAIALLERNNVYLYASEITCCILKNDTKYKHLAGKIKPLTTGQCHILPIPAYNCAPRKEVSVTLIPAGHCPGSVMFLFELSKGNVLFTGDFRITLKDIKQFPQLHGSDGIPKKINSCYLDATFFDELYPSFPTREESLKEVCSFIRETLKTDPSNEILLVGGAKYGYEHIYVEIKDILGMKIHVHDEKYLIYRNVSKISSAITPNCQETRIHACAKFRAPRASCEKNGVKWNVIRMSCFWYQREHVIKGEMVQRCPKYTRICYACHCSHSELVDFIKYLSPKKVVVFASPAGKSTDQVEKEILDVLKTKNRKRERITVTGMDENAITLKMQAKRRVLSGEQRKIQNLVKVSQVQLSEEIWSITTNSETESIERTDISLDSDNSCPKATIQNGSEESLLESSRNTKLDVRCEGSHIDKVDADESQMTHLSQKTESGSGKFSSDSDFSPSFLPQCSTAVVDPQAFCTEERTSSKEIEVITLSSDDSTEIFVID